MENLAVDLKAKQKGLVEAAKWVVLWEKYLVSEKVVDQVVLQVDKMDVMLVVWKDKLKEIKWVVVKVLMMVGETVWLLAAQLEDEQVQWKEV